MIRVWSDGIGAGLLDRHGVNGAAFTYTANADESRAISMTMPVRLASWNQKFGIHPIFEMNLPEGYLREKLRTTFAKATGTFDNLDLLSIVGRSQIGRLRYTAPDANLNEAVPFQSVDELLKHRRDGQLFEYLMDTFAAYSGIAGVQPKVTIRDEKASHALDGRYSSSLQGATHIVKFWEPSEFPHLAANEYFCLLAAEKAGLRVPKRQLSEDASALVIDRFDLRPDGSYMGIEDYCVLNGKGADKKYQGSYETAVFKRTKDFVFGETQRVALESLFTLFVLNVCLRNGDAHLKNFALIYDDVLAMPRLADVYDLVTTTVYLPADTMALTLDCSTRWPNARQLIKLGTLRCGLSSRDVARIFDRVRTAMSDALVELWRYAVQDPSFAEIAERMEVQWSCGLSESLAA